MIITALGAIAIIVGVLAIFSHYRFAIYALCIATAFGSSAAFIMSAMGGASILLAHLLLVLLALRQLLVRSGPVKLVSQLVPPAPGFWLALAVSFGVLLSVVAPSLFGDTIKVLSLDRQSTRGAVLAGLRYNSGNITQSLYAIGDVIGFAALSVLLQTERAYLHLVRALALTAIITLSGAGLNLVSGFVDTSFIFDFVKTAQYAIYDDYDVGGLRRLSGFFSEASAFASYSTPLFMFFFALWYQGYGSRAAGILALSLLVALALSTSTTAYVSLVVILTFFASSALLEIMGGRIARGFVFAVRMAPFLLALPLLIYIFMPSVFLSIGGFLDSTVMGKMQSESGVERTAWNTQALAGFLSSYGLGLGIGSARASSFLLVLLSNVGLVGAISFLIFVTRTLSLQNVSTRDPAPYAIAVALRWAFAAALVTSSISGTVFELGPLFYVFAAGAAVIGRRSGAARRQRAGGTALVQAGAWRGGFDGPVRVSRMR